MKQFFLALFTVLSVGLFAQPYQTKYLQFTSQQQDIKMAYLYEQAPNSAGKTIVLLHGKNFSGTYWTKTITALLKQGYNVLAPDQVGFGSSSMPETYQYSFQQLAINTKKLTDTLQINKPVILGHSMGGMLATRYALMFPNDCSQLILEDPIGLEDWKVFIPYTTIDEGIKTELKRTKEGLKKYMLENYFHQQWKPAYDTLLDESAVHLGERNYAISMALTSDMLYTQPVYYEFEKIKVPTTLIIGDLDRTAPGKEKAPPAVAATLGNYPKLGREAAGRMPGCKLIVLKGIGHIPHEEDFQQFINVLLPVLK